MRRLAPLALLLVLLLLTGAPLQVTHAQATCTHYASPNGPLGNGNGLSQANAFRPVDFWSQTPLAGKTLCLLDGTYSGSTAFMINPPDATAGTGSGASQVITVRALNDGGVFIDGQFTRQPVWTSNSQYLTYRGFDAGNFGNSFSGVYTNYGTSSNITFQRICLSNADYTAPINSLNIHIFAPDGTSSSTFEDMCIFGSGRTPMTEFNVGPGNVYRRMWLRYEGNPPSEAASPSNGTYCPATPTLQYAYNSASGTSLYENVILVHDPEQFNTSTWQSWSGCTQQQVLHAVPYKPGSGRRDPSTGVFRLLGWIIYGYEGFTVVGKTASIGGSQDSWFDELHGRTQMSDFFVDGRSQPNSIGFWLGCSGCASTSADRLTSIKLAATGASDWANTFGSSLPTNRNECSATVGATGASLGGCPSFYTGDTPGTGARNCFEYLNGTLTSTKLWPWRMDDRIKAALARARAASRGGSALAGTALSGVYAANTVTSEIVSRYGTIPSQCISGGSLPPFPSVTDFPANLVPLDTFNRANGPIGSNWTTLSGSGYNVSSNIAVPVSYSDVLWNQNFGADQEVYATVVTPDVDSGSVLYFLSTDLDNRIFVSLIRGGGIDSIDIYRRSSGTFSVVRSGISLQNAFIGGESLGIRVLAGTVNLYYRTSAFEGTPKWYIVDSFVPLLLPTSGKVGIAGNNSFDNFGGGGGGTPPIAPSSLRIARERRR